VAGVYNRSKGRLFVAGDDLRVMLVTSSYTFNPDHDFVADVVANEIAGASGYARQALTSEALTIDDTNDRVALTADNVAFGALGTGASPAAAIVYRHVTNDSDGVLLAYLDFAAPIPTNGSTFTLTWNAGGIARVT
jgi:hypothetical protein